MNNTLGCYEWLEDRFDALDYKDDFEPPAKVTYIIKLSGHCDHYVQFAEWLREQGHTVTLDNPSGSYVNGRWCVSDDWANQVISDLWFDFETQ